MRHIPKLTLPIYLAALLASASLLSACATSNAPAGVAAYERVEYTLGAGDRLRIGVFGEDTMSGEYVVSSAGDVAFPLVGKVPVTGRSVDQLRSHIETTLAGGFIQEPRVSVEVLNYRPFFIFGEVNNAGQFPIDDGLTAIQAVALAGGFSYRADQRKVFLTRVGSSVEEVYELNDGRTIYINPGDTIRIGERYF